MTAPSQSATLKPLLPLLLVAALGALCPVVAHNVDHFLSASGTFWASVMSIAQVALLVVSLGTLSSMRLAPQQRVHRPQYTRH
ncbi:hypothetical protein [Neokomagataea anthophila]|uniref:Uncharacterized protein n=1 Tax=Neokomagataea anthophila TaxID=2826925 RepID=A0ABS5E7N6_9PROT|nr:hypothetical protein [Neokomagataea anthophila]MBR0559931.1 hypothetical protein [Neokomagataea anthophila]